MPPLTRLFSSLFSSFIGTYYIPVLELSVIQISGAVNSLFSNQQRLMCLSDINEKISSADFCFFGLDKTESLHVRHVLNVVLSLQSL